MAVLEPSPTNSASDSAFFFSGTSPYAYAFVIGGIHEDRTAYRGFLYCVLVAVHSLRAKGSMADFVLWAQLSPDSKLLGATNMNEIGIRCRFSKSTFSGEDMRLLAALGIDVRFAEAHATGESYAQLMYHKFRVLTMTEYRRVIFLDADIMPLANLDYMFHLSDEAGGPSNPSKDSALRPNVILATKGEPCNGAMFMVSPGETKANWKIFVDIVERQKEEGLKMPYPHFDKNRGWGHSFVERGDKWEAILRNGTRWLFHAARFDQGLMYYYAKYAAQDVSIIIGPRLQNWVPGEDGEPRKIFDGMFEPRKEVNQTRYEFNQRCQGRDAFKCSNAPYRDFVHFAGRSKPWQTSARSAKKKLWFQKLAEINDHHQAGLDMANWDTKHAPGMRVSPFGYAPKHSDHALLVNSGKTTTTTGGKGGDSDNDGAIDGDSGAAISGAEDGTDDIQSAPTTIAYAVSFIKCGDFQTHSAGLTDASIVLRHSVHKISVRNPASGSRYDYKMYGIVHRQAAECSQVLTGAGFEVLVVDPPVQQDEIRGKHLREHVHREWCCGSDEFIKLYAYNKIPEEIVVHVDIDFAFYKPMDNLFDAMLYGKDTERGRRARSLIQRERETDDWPEQIDAFMTRDWTQVAPGKFPPAYQAGFIVVRRNPEVFDEIVEVIKEGNYTDGWGYGYGWGNKGYGGYVGAMAMQGLIAYYYDHIRPNTAVELNQCRYNHMGVDIRYNNPPNFRRSLNKTRRCRNNNVDDICEDCMVTEFSSIYSVHYTTCRKPWQCQATGNRGGRKPGGGRASAVNINSVKLDHCMGLVRKWHELRQDFENQLYDLTGDESIRHGSNGTYMTDVLLGHCKEDGNSGYILLSGKDDSFRRVPELYARQSRRAEAGRRKGFSGQH